MIATDSILDYLRHGFSVIPIRPRDKLPSREWKVHQTTRATVDDLDAWFSDRPDLNLAVVFGGVSNDLAQRDFDRAGDYETWASDQPKLASRLPTAETARGAHVYFRMTPTKRATILGRVATGETRIGAVDVGDGELRANHGCFSLLPPSVHPSGKCYRWTVPLGDSIPFIDPIEAGLIPKIGRKACLHAYEENRPFEDSKILFAGSRMKARIQDAIRKTIPSGFGQRNGAIFQLARELKAIGELKTLSAADLQDVLADWHRQALPFIRTKAIEETRNDFRRKWNDVRYPAGCGLQAAFERAKRSEVHACATIYRKPAKRLLVTLCRELQLINDPEPFYLGCRDAAKLLDVSNDTGNRWINELVADGILELISKGSKKENRASEYHYVENSASK